jgi:hypothetical protein
LTKQEATEAVREAAVPLLDPCSQPCRRRFSVREPGGIPLPLHQPLPLAWLPVAEVSGEFGEAGDDRIRDHSVVRRHLAVRDQHAAHA